MDGFVAPRRYKRSHEFDEDSFLACPVDWWGVFSVSVVKEPGLEA